MTGAREVSQINNPKSLNNVLLIYDHSWFHRPDLLVLLEMAPNILAIIYLKLH